MIRNKNVIFFLCSVIFVCSCSNQNETIDKIQKALHIKFKIADSDNAMWFIPESYISNFKKNYIYYSIVNYTDTDKRDYYTSEQMKELYGKVKTNEYFDFQFGISPIITKKGETYIVDYFQFAQFDASNIALCRYILLLDDRRAEIIEINPIEDTDIISSDLLSNGYMKAEEGHGRYWDYPKGIEKLAVDIRTDKCKIAFITDWYKASEKLRKAIY